MDFQRLSLVRLEDALCLLKSRRYSAAYYLGGYAVELALKAVIAAQFRACDIPDPNFVRQIYVHQPEALVSLAGLREDLMTRTRDSERFAGHWGVVKEWGPESRYDVVDQFSAQVLLGAITDEADGVLSWIKSYWTRGESKPASS